MESMYILKNVIKLTVAHEMMNNCLYTEYL
jgi:hypothetical protein